MNNNPIIEEIYQFIFKKNAKLILVLSPPKMGKTVFVLSILLNDLIEFKRKFLWISSKYKYQQIATMLISSLSAKRGFNESTVDIQNDCSRLVLNKFIPTKNFIEFNRGINSEELLDLLEIQIIENTPDCIIIDSLLDSCHLNSQDKNLNTIDKLKDIALKYNLHIVILHDCIYQINMGEQFDIKKVRFAFESQAIDLSFYIYRPEYFKVIEYSTGVSTIGEATINVFKNKHCIKRVKLKYDSLNCRFY